MANSLFGNDYDSVQVGGGNRQLPAGGYVCRIMKAQMTQSRTGLPMIEALFDICDGEYANYFHQKFDQNRQRDPNAEYPKNGRIKLTTMDEKGNTRKLWKGFNTSVEHSNGLTLPRDTQGYLNALAGKLIGVIFGREEFEGSDGKIYWATKPRWYRSVADIESGNYDVPEDKYLESGIPMGSGFSFGNSDPIDSFSAAESDIPF